jgi:PAS domain S-box-containing protein
VEQDDTQFEAAAPDTEPGMNLISVDYDLVMVNRTNERLYGKPMVALLGNKCYWEFEKRDEPCPHCPGRLALETGEAHETETTGLRDDGTRFEARIRAHPVIGPDNRPTGFIEIVEDITEQKRAEALARIEIQLQSALAGIQNIRGALREALSAALLVEGIDCGAAFLLNEGGEGPGLVAQHGLKPASLQAFALVAKGGAGYTPAGEAGSPRVAAAIPVLHRCSPLASIVVGSTVYPHIPPSLRSGLLALGATTGTAISRILAEQSRGDAIADLEAVITASPLATWAIDGRGRITMWNRAAEKVFGWRASEVSGSPPPWGPVFSAAGTGPRETVLDRKDGRPVEVRLSTAPFRDVIGNDSALIFIAEDLRAERRILELEAHVARLEARLAAATATPLTPAPEAISLEGVRVLVVDGNEPWGEELAGVLSSLGCIPTRCGVPEQTSAALAQAGATGDAFGVAVVALVGPGGASGLGQRAALRSLGLQAPVVMSSDVEVRGHEQHGIAAVIKRPYNEDAVRDALMTALRQVSPD